MAAASKPQDAREINLGLLYRMYRAALLRFLARRVGQEDAADLAQEAFLRIARAGGQAGAIRNDKAFLFQVAANLAADHGRETRRLSCVLTPGEVDAILAVPDEAALADAAIAGVAVGERREAEGAAAAPGFVEDGNVRLALPAALVQQPSEVFGRPFGTVSRKPGRPQSQSTPENQLCIKHGIYR